MNRLTFAAISRLASTIGRGKKAVSLLMMALLLQLPTSQEARAGGDGYLGWASHGLYFGSPTAACQEEFNYYLGTNPSAVFHGSTPLYGKFCSSRCIWDGLPLPN